MVREAPLSRVAGEGSGEGADADAWIAIAVGSDAEWTALCNTIGRPELVNDPRFADVVNRYRNHAEADAIIAAWTVQRSAPETMRTLQAAGVAAGAALSMPELLTDPHYRARGVFRTVVHPEQGPIPHTRTAFKISGHPQAGPRLPAPRFGQDNEAIFYDLLGLAPQDYDALVEADVVTDRPRAVE